jgi:hypothetical protein
MAKQATALGKDEKRRSQSDDRDEQLLFTRQQVANLIGRPLSFVQALEKAGKLKGLRLSGKPTGLVFFRRADVLALIEEAPEASHD